MLFNSLRFLVFFPCVFLLYFALPFRWRKYLLLLASYYFYMCWKPEFIVLILISTAIDYFCSLGIEKYQSRPALRRGLLLVSMVSNLGLLFFFKYANFFGETLTALCRAISIPFSAPLLNIILPVGISFYTFQTMSYTIDVYRGKLPAERSFVLFALFVSFFPQLVAGPIEKAENLLPQLKEDHVFSYDNAAYGLKLMAWGFFKKLVVADQLARLIDPVYNNVHAYSGGALVLATCAFAFQIYCDFGGYSDIARGCAKTMGIDLMVNFKSPYFFSKSISEYWQRNHISLNDWFHDYVYIPLGGNRKGIPKKHLFVLITFFLSGLWHGASWTFVVWGLLQAVYLNVEDLLKRHTGLYRFIYANRKRRVLSTLITYSLSCFSLIFFRANSMGDAFYVIRNSIVGLSSPLQYCKAAAAALNLGVFLPLCIAGSLLVLFVFDFINEKRDTIQLLSSQPKLLRWTVYVVFLFGLLLLIPKETVSPFLYFQF